MRTSPPFGRRQIAEVATPERLVVAAPPGNDLELILALLTAAGFSGGSGTHPQRRPALVDAATCGGFDALPGWLEGDPGAHLLLLFSAPVDSIAQSMNSGVEPAEAIAIWQESAEPVLSLVRRARRRLTLLPIQRVLANQRVFIELLSRRFGFALTVPDGIGEAASEPPSAIFRMMAENAIWNEIEVRHLAAELEASAIPMTAGEGDSRPAVDRVYHEYRTSIDTAQDSARQAAHENETLLERLRQSSEEVEATRKESDELQKRIHALEEEAKSSEKVQELNEENELLLHQLQQVQEELETHFLENRDLQNKLANAQKQKLELEGQTKAVADSLAAVQVQAKAASDSLAAVYASVSWKVTAPLRAVFSPFMRGKEARAAQPENPKT